MNGLGLKAGRKSASPEQTEPAAPLGEGDPHAEAGLVLLATVLVAMVSAHGPEPSSRPLSDGGRRRRHNRKLSQTLLLDTATGQTWILSHETGQSIQWLHLSGFGRKAIAAAGSDASPTLTRARAEGGQPRPAPGRLANGRRPSEFLSKQEHRPSLDLARNRRGLTELWIGEVWRACQQKLASLVS